MDYSFHTKQDISKPIIGKEKVMEKNLAGGYAFKADDFVALKRWLLTGSQSNAYYQNKKELTDLNVELLRKLVDENPGRVTDEIIYATNFGINNHTPILALVYLSNGEFQAKKNFRAIFSKVIRTASHLYEFMNYTKAIRGMGTTIHKAVKGWLSERNSSELEYQFLKYQSRYNWTGRDILRTIKPVSEDSGKNLVYKWVVGKFDPEGKLPKENISSLQEHNLKRLEAYEILKYSVNMSEREVIEWITDQNLTHEMIPANIKRTDKIWEALFQKMPVGASLRNLGNLTSKGILNDFSNLNVLESRFVKENLKRGRLHPLVIISALNIYSKGGELGRSNLSWEPVPKVIDILNQAVIDAFDVLEPTNKFFFHGIDISPSMQSAYNETLWMTAADIAGVMALTSAKVEKNYFIGGFAKTFAWLKTINQSTPFTEVMDRKYMRGLNINWGGTNAASAFEYAINTRTKVDVFCVWTDNESWIGSHPSKKLKEYRDRINPNAKAIYITLVPYGDRITLVDPEDSNGYDIVGFSSETIKLIQMIAKGEF